MSYICPACGEAANYSVCEKCGGWGKPQPPISHSGLCGLAEHEAVFAPNAELASLRTRVAELEAALERISDFEYEVYDDHIRLTQGDPEQFALALEAVRGTK